MKCHDSFLYHLARKHKIIQVIFLFSVEQHFLCDYLLKGNILFNVAITYLYFIPLTYRCIVAYVNVNPLPSISVKRLIFFHFHESSILFI